ncbi:MAG: hypothetical protein JWO03_125 [Bacteroidetes bacterium]|nr:hypothetical protein [Bacteroidota bacterium]
MALNDQNIEIAKLQKDIITKLGISQDNAIFNFKQKNDVVRFDLVTINPKHEQSFLFNTIHGTDKVDALRKMLEYIDEHYAKEGSMTIQWIKIGDNKLHTSYFRAKNMYDALDKFYYERDMNQYKIFSITLNPVS